jgi:hypothetical protein
MPGDSRSNGAAFLMDKLKQFGKISHQIDLLTLITALSQCPFSIFPIGRTAKYSWREHWQ